MLNWLNSYSISSLRSSGLVVDETSSSLLITYSKLKSLLVANVVIGSGCGSVIVILQLSRKYFLNKLISSWDGKYIWELAVGTPFWTEWIVQNTRLFWLNTSNLPNGYSILIF
jgi:hypothetical protein